MSPLVHFMLLCTAFTMDPLLGSRAGPFDASLTIEGSLAVQLQGFPNIRSFDTTHAYDDGEALMISGAGSDMGFVVWGKLESGPEDYQLSWFMPGEWKSDGGYTIAQIGEANCKMSEEGADQ